MKVAEAVDFMTKAYLHRIIDSFTKDLPRPDVDRSREIILRNSEELTEPERIRTVLRFDGPYADQILQEYILEALINRPKYRASEAEIIDNAFEEGTRFLFREKLGLELLEMDGSDHADGCFVIGRGGDVLMWDNKSEETVYRFPRAT